VDTSTHTLSVDASTAPKEVRLFRRGLNETTKGTFLFDDAAATAVMAAYRKQSVDLMIDLDHESLGDHIRPDSGDARGWAQLEVRSGELWLTSIRWTPDGLSRLSRKTHRYLSPCFRIGEDSRIVEIVNVALVAMPATHGAPALVAASKTTKGREAMLSFRAPERMVAAIDSYGKAHGLSRSAVIRQLAKAITPEGDAGTLREIARVLGLESSASPADVKAALDELFNRVGSEPESDPLADGAAPSLSPTEQTALSKIKDPKARANFVALRKQRAADRARTAPKKKGK
jgi:hypothetical protein